MPSESVKSGRMSGKYRVKSRTSQVDETLFSSNERLKLPKCGIENLRDIN